MPACEPAALEVLAGKQNVRVLERGALGRRTAPAPELKSVAGGLLVQARDDGRVEADGLKIVTRRAPYGRRAARTCVFAWRVCKHVKSNAIVLARDGRTVGVGAGQMSRVDSARIAVDEGRRRGQVAGAVLASDAFFPFRDGVDAAAGAGISAVIQPGGSLRDDEVIAAADERGMAMVFTGMRHFRH